MIHPSGTFEYEAEFTSDGFRDSEIVLHGIATNMKIDRLVGHHPMIRFWDDRVILVASEQSHSRMRNFSFFIGDAVSLLARPGDRLHLVRTGRGGLGLSLLREKTLVLAIGAVSAVPLGMNMNVSQEPKRQRLEVLRDIWLEFRLEGQTLQLRSRELVTVGNYQIYIERCWEDGIPGTDECVSMWCANDPTMNIPCIRSAILLAKSPSKMTEWDGTEL